MLDQLQTLSANFKTTDLLLSLSVADLNADTATQPSRTTEGPSILWQIEHMLTHRHTILRLLDAPQLPNPPAKDAPVDLGQTLDRWNTTANHLQNALDRCTPATLEAEARGGPHGETTVFQLVNFLSWHESYHFGGLGSTRKVLGLTGVADLAHTHQQAQKTTAQEVALAS